MRRMVLVGLGWFLAGGALAQATDALPGKLSGWWTATNPRGVFKNTLSLEVDGNAQAGPVTGRLTVNGRSCGAQDEPFRGTWDGTTLRFETTHRPNVNAMVKDGTCGSGQFTYVLRRKPGERTFEGELFLDGTTATGITISMSP